MVVEEEEVILAVAGEDLALLMIFEVVCSLNSLQDTDIYLAECGPCNRR